jgi:hypothetical protein
MGSGISRMARSITIHGMSGMMARRCLLPQCAAVVGFQLYSIGMQIKLLARMVPTHYKMTMTPMILVASLKMGVTKMRW